MTDTPMSLDVLTDQQVRCYEQHGFLFLPGCLLESTVECLRRELPRVFAEDTPRRVMEKDGQRVRSVYGSHATEPVFADLCRYPRLLGAAMRLLDSEVYVHQFKINAKAALGGDVWEWHQDYIFWLKEDGIPSCRLTNAVVFLDEVNEFNGPLLLVPGSHHAEVLDGDGRAGAGAGYEDAPSWISNLTAELKYNVDGDTVSRLVREHGIEAPKGPRGSVLFFHPDVVHGSSPNMSPFDRSLLIVTYNSTSNLPVGTAGGRPEFLASRDYEPLTPVPELAGWQPALDAGR